MTIKLETWTVIIFLRELDPASVKVILILSSGKI